MAAWLARAAVFALPARYEPFGLLPLEAALSGCALVLGDIESLREVWGDAADYVDPDDADALARTINTLIASPERLHAASGAAYAQAVGYGMERTAAAYVDLYQRAGVPARVRGTLTCAL